MGTIKARRLLQHAIDSGDADLAALCIATSSMSLLAILQKERATISIPERFGLLCRAVADGAPALTPAPHRE